MRSSKSPLLCFHTLISPHRHNCGLPPLVCHWINHPEIGHHWLLTHSQDDNRCCFLHWAEYSKDSQNGNQLLKLSAGYEEAADMMDLFVGWSAGCGKRPTAALALKGALVNDHGSVDVIPCSRWDKYIQSAVHISSTHSMFNWTTNLTLPRSCRVLPPT